MKTSRDMAQEIKQSTGFFTVTFRKKDGTIRKMNARMDVKKHLKGGVSLLDPDQYLTVWDVQKKDYRAINKDNIIEVKGV